MKVSTFFKILNKKIEKYDKLASNPFTNPKPITLIWVEDSENCRYFEAETTQEEKEIQ